MMASIFSAYTIIGVPSDAFKLGYVALYWVTATSITQGGMLIVGPPLQALAKRHDFLSPADYIKFRFDYQPLTLAMSFVTIVPTAIYALAQFRGIGSTIAGLTGDAVPPIVAALVLAVIMLAYEYLGGMRSVAYNDSIQGMVILTSFIFLIIIVAREYGGFVGSVEGIETYVPQFTLIPSGESQVGYISFCLLFMCFPFYPHLMQRAYAAKDSSKLKTTTAVMGFMPLYVSFCSLMLGIVALSKFANDPSVTPDETFALISTEILQINRFSYWTVVFLLCGSVAALMSTTDSLLMSVSSAFLNDILKPYVFPGKGQVFYVRAANITTLLVTIFCVGMVAADIDLSTLVAFQSNILIQAAPVFLSGLMFRDAVPRCMLAGVIVGLCITFGLIIADKAKVGGMHAGTLASLFNALVGVGGSYLYNAMYDMAQEEPPHDTKETDMAHKDHPELEGVEMPEYRDADAVVERVAKRQVYPDSPAIGPNQAPSVPSADKAMQSTGAMVPAGPQGKGSDAAAPSTTTATTGGMPTQGSPGEAPMTHEGTPESAAGDAAAIRRTTSMAGDGKPRKYSSLADLLHRRHDEPREMVDGDFPHQRWYVWVALFVPLLFTVPFYRKPGAQDDFIAGLPSWAFVSTVFSWVLAVAMAACAFLFWPTPLGEKEAALREKQAALEGGAEEGGSKGADSGTGVTSGVAQEGKEQEEEQKASAGGAAPAQATVA